MQIDTDGAITFLPRRYPFYEMVERKDLGDDPRPAPEQMLDDLPPGEISTNNGRDSAGPALGQLFSQGERRHG